LIGAFKTVSAKRINCLRRSPGAPLWHRNYFDHIIRNEDALASIREYIRTNPDRWDRRGRLLVSGDIHHR
jgi:REP element-mobilizing transposase RayT